MLTGPSNRGVLFQQSKEQFYSSSPKNSVLFQQSKEHCFIPAVGFIPAVQRTVYFVPAVQRTVCFIPAVQRIVRFIPAVQGTVCFISAVQRTVCFIPAVQRTVCFIPASPKNNRGVLFQKSKEQQGRFISAVQRASGVCFILVV